MVNYITGNDNVVNNSSTTFGLFFLDTKFINNFFQLTWPYERIVESSFSTVCKFIPDKESSHQPHHVILPPSENGSAGYNSLVENASAEPDITVVFWPSKEAYDAGKNNINFPGKIVVLGGGQSAYIILSENFEREKKWEYISNPINQNTGGGGFTGTVLAGPGTTPYKPLDPEEPVQIAANAPIYPLSFTGGGPEVVIQPWQRGGVFISDLTLEGTIYVRPPAPPASTEEAAPLEGFYFSVFNNSDFDYVFSKAQLDTGYRIPSKSFRTFYCTANEPDKTVMETWINTGVFNTAIFEGVAGPGLIPFINVENPSLEQLAVSQKIVNLKDIGTVVDFSKEYTIDQKDRNVIFYTENITNISLFYLFKPVYDPANPIGAPLKGFSFSVYNKSTNLTIHFQENISSSVGDSYTIAPHSFVTFTCITDSPAVSFKEAWICSIDFENKLIRDSAGYGMISYNSGTVPDIVSKLSPNCPMVYAFELENQVYSLTASDRGGVILYQSPEGHPSILENRVYTPQNSSIPEGFFFSIYNNSKTKTIFFTNESTEEVNSINSFEILPETFFTFYCIGNDPNKTLKEKWTTTKYSVTHSVNRITIPQNASELVLKREQLAYDILEFSGELTRPCTIWLEEDHRPWTWSIINKTTGRKPLKIGVDFDSVLETIPVTVPGNVHSSLYFTNKTIDIPVNIDGHKYSPIWGFAQLHDNLYLPRPVTPDQYLIEVNANFGFIFVDVREKKLPNQNIIPVENELILRLYAGISYESISYQDDFDKSKIIRKIVLDPYVNPQAEVAAGRAERAYTFSIPTAGLNIKNETVYLYVWMEVVGGQFSGEDIYNSFGTTNNDYPRYFNEIEAVYSSESVADPILLPDNDATLVVFDGQALYSPYSDLQNALADSPVSLWSVFPAVQNLDMSGYKILDEYQTENSIKVGASNNKAVELKEPIVDSVLGFNNTTKKTEWQNEPKVTSLTAGAIDVGTLEVTGDINFSIPFNNMLKGNDQGKVSLINQPLQNAFLINQNNTINWISEAITGQDPKILILNQTIQSIHTGNQYYYSSAQFPDPVNYGMAYGNVDIGVSVPPFTVNGQGNTNLPSMYILLDPLVTTVRIKATFFAESLYFVSNNSSDISFRVGVCSASSFGNGAIFPGRPYLIDFECYKAQGQGRRPFTDISIDHTFNLLGFPSTENKFFFFYFFQNNSAGFLIYHQTIPQMKIDLLEVTYPNPVNTDLIFQKGNLITFDENNHMTIIKPGATGQTLKMVNGIPTWSF